YFEAFTPKFVKKYANLAEVITGALKEYVDDVRTGRFPAPEHSYSVLKEELEAFNKVVERYKSSRKKP
ncbi:MAG: 3-methyl-2-oxobutanoate hydroxymethyltransferase, partial [Planctomycetota bacterium]